MKEEKVDVNPERKEMDKLDNYKVAIKDARYVFNTYKNTCPAEAWECLRKIIFNSNLK